MRGTQFEPLASYAARVGPGPVGLGGTVFDLGAERGAPAEREVGHTHGGSARRAAYPADHRGVRTAPPLLSPP